MLQEATLQAEQVRRQAYSDGYRDGVLSAADSVLSFLDDSQNLAREAQQQIQVSARHMLAAALNSPEAILTVLEDWLHQHPDLQPHILQLILPRSAYAWRHRVMALLEDGWGSRLQVDYHDEARFLLRCGNRVAEFNPTVVADQGEYLLARELDHFPSSLRQLSEEAAASLHANFMEKFTTSATTN
ncbi:hypothetical protein QN359_15285 [Undibacterium sp. 5I2]|nr:hypothetical protein [Undibacterium sp. 5I2]